ncbi:hypothetical protein A3Q56_05733 [Intoshia linei]|uniref:Uncharacterized protein n=1 Tax=Intoshia linei TaxID=1819745 RepID=A0A177AYF4_9BILA|nr:hypothetical protein A3Q56_05733 [Intoshia linei]
MNFPERQKRLTQIHLDYSKRRQKIFILESQENFEKIVQNFVSILKLHKLKEKQKQKNALKNSSWTRAVPIIDNQRLHFSVSNNIGTNYSPNSKNVHIQSIETIKLKKNKCTIFSLYFANFVDST